MDEIITQDEFKKRYGFNPVNEKAPSVASSSDSSEEIISPQEFKKRYGIDPVSNKKTTTDFKLLPTRWEDGTDDSVDRSGLGNVATGVAKTLVRTPVNLLQAITRDKWFGENSLLNSESQKAQDFAEATRREGKTQKIAGGLTDIGLAFVPGGAVSKVGKGIELASMAGLARTAPKVLEGTNALSKLTRFAPKVTGSVAESVAGSAVMRGPDDKDNLASDIGWGVATPTVLAGFKYIPSLLKKGGTKLAMMEKSKDFVSNTKNDPATIGRFLTAEKNNSDAIKQIVSDLPQESRFSKWIKDKQQQLTNLEYISPEQDVIDISTQYGGPRKLQANGKYDTADIVSTIQSDKQKIADASDKFVKSSNVKIPTTEVANFNSKVNSIIDGITDVEETRKILKEKAAKSLESQFGGKAFITPDDMNRYSKSLRKEAFDAVSGGAKDTDKANFSRAIARVMDDTLQQTLDTQGTAYFKEFKKMYTLLDASQHLWEGISKVKPKGILGQGFVNMGGAIGAISGGLVHKVLSLVWQVEKEVNLSLNLSIRSP